MLPNLVVIGGMKCGTTSLHHYLGRHPEITMSAIKELNFFVAEKNWRQGVEWYEAQFPANGRIRGEASPDYTKHPRFSGIPERMHRVVPDAKLVYLVRDPIERMVSHYIDSYSFGREHGSIEVVLGNPVNNHYVNCSRYFMQLQNYLPYYPKSRIFVLTTEDLKADRKETLAGLFRFLGVDDSFYCEDYGSVLYTAEEKRRNTRVGYGLESLARRVGKSPVRRVLPAALARPIRGFNAATAKRIERPVLGERLRRELVAAVKDDIDEFRAFTGRSFESWSV